jgi:hypothetical protein
MTKEDKLGVVNGAKLVVLNAGATGCEKPLIEIDKKMIATKTYFNCTRILFIIIICYSKTINRGISNI